jgi:hypothetical protein
MQVSYPDDVPTMRVLLDARCRTREQVNDYQPRVREEMLALRCDRGGRGRLHRGLDDVRRTFGHREL